MWCHNNQCALMSGTFVANPTVVAPASGSGYVSPFDLDTHIMSLQEKVKDLPDHANRLTEPDWALLNELQKWRLKQASGYIPSTSTGSASTEINLDKIKTEFLGNPQDKLKSEGLTVNPTVALSTPTSTASTSGIDAVTELKIDKIQVASLPDLKNDIKSDTKMDK